MPMTKLNLILFLFISFQAKNMNDAPQFFYIIVGRENNQIELVKEQLYLI